MHVQAEVEVRPLLYGNFMTFQEETPIYDAIPNYDILRKTLDAKLAEYNESNPAMDLVLFQQVFLTQNSQTVFWHSVPMPKNPKPFLHIECHRPKKS